VDFSKQLKNSSNFALHHDVSPGNWTAVMAKAALRRYRQAETMVRTGSDFWHFVSRVRAFGV